MYPEVEKYIKAVEAAEEGFSREVDTRYRATRETTAGAIDYTALQAMWDEYDTVRKTLEEARRAEIDRARSELQAALTDPVVVWIAQHVMEEDNDYGLEVLKMLPTSVSEIKWLARENEWCERFQQYLLKARRDGVVPMPDPMEAREELRDWFGGFGVDEAAHDTLNALVAQIVAAELAAHRG
jgi:hypothetical protein